MRPRRQRIDTARVAALEDGGVGGHGVRIAAVEEEALRRLEPEGGAAIGRNLASGGALQNRARLVGSVGGNGANRRARRWAEPGLGHGGLTGRRGTRVSNYAECSEKRLGRPPSEQRAHGNIPRESRMSLDTAILGRDGSGRLLRFVVHPLEAGKSGNGRSVEDLPVRIVARPVAGAVPALFGGVPFDDALEVGADRRTG